MSAGLAAPQAKNAAPAKAAKQQAVAPPAVEHAPPVADEGLELEGDRESDRSAGYSSLVVGSADDPLERDADRVADEVMRGGVMRGAAMRALGPRVMRAPQGSIYRECATCKEKTPSQGTCSKCGAAREDKVLRKRGSGPAVIGSLGGPVSGDLAQRVRTLPTRALPQGVRSFMEPRFGRSLSHVRVATGGAAEEVSGLLGARAFSLENTIAFGRGAFDPTSHRGRRLLAHEIAHTMQGGTVAGPQLLRRVSVVEAAQQIRSAGAVASPNVDLSVLSLPQLIGLSSELGGALNDASLSRPEREAIKTYMKEVLAPEILSRLGSQGGGGEGATSATPPTEVGGGVVLDDEDFEVEDVQHRAEQELAGAVELGRTGTTVDRAELTQRVRRLMADATQLVETDFIPLIEPELGLVAEAMRLRLRIFDAERAKLDGVTEASFVHLRDALVATAGLLIEMVKVVDGEFEDGRASGELALQLNDKTLRIGRRIDALIRAARKSRPELWVEQALERTSKLVGAPPVSNHELRQALIVLEGRSQIDFSPEVNAQADARAQQIRDTLGTEAGILAGPRFVSTSEDSERLLDISDPTEMGRKAAAQVHFEIRNRGDISRAAEVAEGAISTLASRSWDDAKFFAEGFLDRLGGEAGPAYRLVLGSDQGMELAAVIDQAMDLGLTASTLEMVENLGGALDDISEAAIKAIVEGARLVKDEAFFAARAGLDEFGPSLGFEPDSIAFLHGGLKSAEGLADGVLNLISFSAGFAITAAKSVLEGVVALPGAVVDISSAIAELTFSMVELGPGKTYDNLKAQAVVFFDGFQKTVVEQTEVWLKKYEKANEQQRQAMLGGLVARILELLLGAVAGAKALARTAVTAKRVGVAGVSKAKARVGRGGGVDGRPRRDGDAVLERRSELEPRRKAELETAMEAGTGNKAYDTIPESAKKAELEFLEDGPVKRESFTDGDGNKYDAVVELPNGHRFRRGKDGRWCRFSTKKASVCVVGRSSGARLDADAAKARTQEFPERDRQDALKSEAAKGSAAAAAGGGVPKSISRADLGDKLGSGGNKDVFAFGDDLAVGVLKPGKKAEGLVKEIQDLKMLEDAGLPTVRARGPIDVDGRPAVIFDRFAAGSKDVVKVVGQKPKVVGRSSLLNARSAADLRRILKKMQEIPVKIDDLQFLIARDGRIVIADPLKVAIGSKPNRKNIRMIQLLIDVAEGRAL